MYQIARKSTAPRLFDVALSLFKDITMKSNFSKSQDIVVASPSFAKSLFNGKAQEEAHRKRPENALANQTETVLRGYNTLMPHEGRIRSLLVQHGGNCDTTFLEAVWWYSRALGIKTFPGLYDAPMGSVAVVQAVAVGGAAASSQPHPTPPTHRVSGKQSTAQVHKR